MSDLPPGWKTVPFGLLNAFCSETLDPASFPMERFELYSVPAFPAGNPDVVSGSEIGSTKQLVQPGDVLVCKINPRINRVWQVREQTGARQIASSEWIGFRIHGQCSRYYRYYFASAGFRNLLRTDLTGVGGSLTRAQPKRVAEFPVPVAPVGEQKRIADKLDTVLVRVGACRDRLDSVVPLLARIRKAVLNAAVTGGLTREWRLSRNVLFPWQRTRVGDLVSIKNGRAFPSSAYTTQGVRLLRPGNMHASGTIEWNTQNTRCLPAEFAETFEDYILGRGELVMNLTAQSLKDEFLGRTCLKEDAVPALLNQRICAFVPKGDWDSRPYLHVYFRSPTFREYVDTLDSGTLIKHIHSKQIVSHALAMPSQEEATEVVRRVETLFAFADRLEARLTAAQSAIDRLTPALLAKAFRGELVPQDPADEPATELLKRLQAETGQGPQRATAKRARPAQKVSA